MKQHITGPMYLILRTANPPGIMTIEGEYICSDFHISPLRKLCNIICRDKNLLVFFEERNPACTSSHKKRMRVKSKFTFVEQQGLSLTAGGGMRNDAAGWETVQRVHKNVNISYCDPAITLLGVYPKKLKTMSTKKLSHRYLWQLYNCQNLEDSKISFSR